MPNKANNKVLEIVTDVSTTNTPPRQRAYIIGKSINSIPNTNIPINTANPEKKNDFPAFKVIIYSFQGDIQLAIDQTNYQWLMFYPCLYMFSIWDAYRDAGGGKSLYFFLPFVFSAYFVTVGLIYSSSLKIFGVLFGPVFLPMLFLIPGISIGLLIKIVLGNLNISLKG